MSLRKTPIYSVWHEMLRRCYDPRRKYFPQYGGRGIKVCEGLRASVVNLFVLIGQKPSAEFSLDRTNNKGSYTCGDCAECLKNGWPLNVRWATRTQQNRNRENVHKVSINGKTLTRPEWSEISGINYSTIRGRMRDGKRGDALIAPPNKGKLTADQRLNVGIRKLYGESNDVLKKEFGICDSTIRNYVKLANRLPC